MVQFLTIRRCLSTLRQRLIYEHRHVVTANARALTFYQDFRGAAKVIEQLRRVNEDVRNRPEYRETLMILEPVLLGVMGKRHESMEHAQVGWAQTDRGF